MSKDGNQTLHCTKRPKKSKQTCVFVQHYHSDSYIGAQKLSQGKPRHFHSCFLFFFWLQINCMCGKQGIYQTSLKKGETQPSGLTSVQKGWSREGRSHRETSDPDPAGGPASSGLDVHSSPEGKQENSYFFLFYVYCKLCCIIFKYDLMADTCITL